MWVCPSLTHVGMQTLQELHPNPASQTTEMYIWYSEDTYLNVFSCFIQILASNRFYTTKRENEDLLHPNIKLRLHIKSCHYLKKRTSKPNSTLCNQRLWSIKREWEDVLYLPLNLCFCWRLFTALLCLNKGRKDTWRSPDVHWMPKDVP